ncbi:PIG-L deacetylase family protein [Deinococcus multiflagellatus]|uniref:PIG-L deacetylase family protein n=1 Tax=Deinococcus multiflagellatus TaxID=1656887 RepID=A0ABW1ZFB9_9DEIO|nr:PIG-L deacetylase family protein [Deinococcus multiflagellatus]MBZ9712038.1 PIG-L family deacetylase [Deinococcus multiflagellatus]
MSSPSPAGPPRRWLARSPRFWALGAALILGLVAAFAINATPAVGLLYPRARAEVAALPPAPGFASGRRVLLVSPHPDDESLCCAGQLQEAQRAGAQVYVVWLTSGDGFELDAAALGRTARPHGGATERLGARRMAEARAAARVLGVPAAHLTFLGYPDGALLRLYRAPQAQVVRSPHTGATRVPYAGTLHPGAAYTGANLRRDLAEVFDRVRPDVVLLPSSKDAHRDHRATSLLVQDLLQARGQTARARYWVVHGGLEWPLPKGLHPQVPLLLPPRGHSLTWTRADLSRDETARKAQAIAAHRSQMAVMPRFLQAFVRTNELVALDDPHSPQGGHGR